MISKPLAFGLLAAGCLTAAAGGAYLATRSNTADSARAQQVAAPAQPTAPAQPVSESEGVVTPPAAAPTDSETAQPARPEAPATIEGARKPAEAAERPRSPEAAPRAATERAAHAQSAPATPPRHAPGPSSTAPAGMPERPSAAQNGTPTQAQNAPSEPQRAPEPAAPPAPPAPPAPQFQEVVVPASAVIGLQVETPVSSERARVEDRVQARVTRDVMAGDRVAIPAGSRVLGTVTAVDRGGKIKERARLDVRFHTVVLANGTEVPMRTETISRYGESPAGDSARKIGGAAVGGAILGAIMGGGKGAVIGGAAGAGGGTAVVMAGDRNAATLPAGTVLSVRLSNPVSIEVEK